MMAWPSTDIQEEIDAKDLRPFIQVSIPASPARESLRDFYLFKIP